MNIQNPVSTPLSRETKSRFFRKVNEVMRRIRRPTTRANAVSRAIQLEFPLSD